MSELVLLQAALCLPAPDVDALIQGRTIAAMPRTFIEPGRKFALYPAGVSINPLPPAQYYRSSFLPVVQTALSQLGAETVAIKAWARCEGWEDLDNTASLDGLSPLTVWTAQGLQKTLSQRGRIFLKYLRVYLLPYPLQVTVQPEGRNKTGKFVPLPYTLRVAESVPALSDSQFAHRRVKLEKREVPAHPELEELQAEIAQIALTNPAAKQLDGELKIFLGWRGEVQVSQLDADLNWIATIAALGNRSKHLDEGKSNYQAGTDFENIVRRSLEFLGFTVDYFHRGGAGAIDLFCSKPYPLVGECKSGKKIPNDTAVQLLNLGTLRLKDPELLKKVAKLIIGPGEPTPQLLDAAKVHGMAILNPETLEKLVRLQSKYPGAVDLFKLKDCLKPGQSDGAVEKYIALAERQIVLRSHLIGVVKKYQENTGDEAVGVDTIYGAYNSHPPQSLTREEMREILIELSSPLTGYLGRIKGSDSQRDSFYFLRELPVDS
ncbi:MAG: DUF1802 family protein [Oscillatoria princeps RMCB-10]|jgi:hypothetical protein|nr:DUF1802 family protein [Oscillatoria princeps RMCB-10]